MDERIKKALFRRVREEPFAQKFRIELVDLDEGYSRVTMVFTPDMENIFGLAHGGAVFALMDEAFQTACNSYGTVALALQVNVTYVASPKPGSRLTAEAREFSRTAKTAGYDIRVHDPEGRLIAACQALAYRKGSPLPFLESEVPVPARPGEAISD
jgi:acyl-CoA thioesterase